MAFRKFLREELMPGVRARYRTTDETAIVGESHRFAAAVQANAPPGLQWHYEPMRQEKHSTIYHPAALKAFRAVFRP